MHTYLHTNKYNSVFWELFLPWIEKKHNNNIPFEMFFFSPQKSIFSFSSTSEQRNSILINNFRLQQQQQQNEWMIDSLPKNSCMPMGIIQVQPIKEHHWCLEIWEKISTWISMMIFQLMPSGLKTPSKLFNFKIFIYLLIYFTL